MRKGASARGRHVSLIRKIQNGFQKTEQTEYSQSVLLGSRYLHRSLPGQLQGKRVRLCSFVRALLCPAPAIHVRTYPRNLDTRTGHLLEHKANKSTLPRSRKEQRRALTDQRNETVRLPYHKVYILPSTPQVVRRLLLSLCLWFVESFRLMIAELGV